MKKDEKYEILKEIETKNRIIIEEIKRNAKSQREDMKNQWIYE